MPAPRSVPRNLTPLVVAALAASALAQDYTVSSQSGLYQAPPANSTQLALGNTQATLVALPFAFPYYGQGYSSVIVSSEGYVQFGFTSVTVTPANATFPRTGTTDGLVGPYWDDLSLNVAGQVRHWTSGTAPARTFTVSWEGVAVAASTASRITFQVRLFEDTGRIEFAYKPNTTPSTWGTSSYTPGIDAFGVGDNRFATPSGMNVLTNNGHPPADYRFEPTVRVISGRLLYDRVASDATGVGGGGVFQNQPLSNVRVELRAPNGTLAGAAVTDDGGNFFVSGIALNSAHVGSLAAVASNAACRVLPSVGSTPHAQTFLVGVPFSATSNQGTYALTSASDPNDVYLPAFHVATVLGGLRALLQPHTADPIVQIDAVYDRSSGAATSFARPAPPAAAVLRVASAAAANPDAWDTDVLTKCYAAGPVLGAIAAYPAVPYDARIDAFTSPENAFAEGFGYAVFTAVTGRTTYVDATGASSADVIDLESPSFASPKGPAVAGWVAAALVDLADGLGEPHDRVDGTTDAGLRAFAVADSLTAAATAEAFHAAWGAVSSEGGAALTRDFVFHGLLADDALELDDDAGEAAPLGEPGFRRENLVLNRYGEDWYEVTLPAAAASLGADVDFDRGAFAGASLVLEIRDATDFVIAAGAAPNAFSPYSAASGPVSAGTYRVRVVHAGGPRIDAYALQVHRAMSIEMQPLGGWTVDADIDHAAPVTGGIPPYSLSIDAPFVKPPGIVLDSDALAIRGRPSEPGSYDFVLTVRDGGNPRHETSLVQSFTVNLPLRLAFGRHLAVALAKPLSLTLARSGGTAPFRFDVDGAPPVGLALADADLSLSGTPTAPGSAAIGVSAADAAGTHSSAATTIVVTVPLDGSTALGAAAGPSACGVWFDALAGSTVTFAVKTAKGSAKRALTASVLDAAGRPVAGGRLAAGSGSAKGSDVIVPATGRHFLVLDAADGPAASLLAVVKVTPPKSGAGGDATFKVGDFVDVRIAALAGAKLTLTAKPDKGSGLATRILVLIDPDGALVPLDGLVKEKGGAATITATLPRQGTWTVRIGAKPGANGSMTYAYKLQQPKGGVFSLGE